MATLIVKNKNLAKEMHIIVANAFREALKDTKLVLDLTDSAKKRLNQALKSKGKRISFETIKAKYA